LSAISRRFGNLDEGVDHQRVELRPGPRDGVTGLFVRKAGLYTRVLMSASYTSATAIRRADTDGIARQPCG
jgi:hypothetical protein